MSPFLPFERSNRVRFHHRTRKRLLISSLQRRTLLVDLLVKERHFVRVARLGREHHAVRGRAGRRRTTPPHVPDQRLQARERRRGDGGEGRRASLLRVQVPGGAGSVPGVSALGLLSSPLVHDEEVAERGQRD